MVSSKIFAHLNENRRFSRCEKKEGDEHQSEQKMSIKLMMKAFEGTPQKINLKHQQASLAMSDKFAQDVKMKWIGFYASSAELEDRGSNPASSKCFFLPF